jgi:hypothetical protein
MSNLQNIKDHVAFAIDAMEGLYGQDRFQTPDWQYLLSRITGGYSKLGAALMVVGRFRNEPVICAQAWIIWKQAICRRLPTVWFVRSPAGKIVFNAMCFLAGVSVQKIVNSELTEKDFARLTCAARYLAAAPVRICEISETNHFKESIEALAAENSFSFAVCDWELEGEDLALGEHFARTLSLTFLCPR